MAKLTEDFVKEQIIFNWLYKNGWSRRLQTKSKDKHGVDIKVMNDKYPRYFLIEVKGEPDETVKAPSSRREVSFNYALGQIVSRMKYRARYEYGVGFPISFKSKVLTRLPYMLCKKLNLHVFFVDSTGKVEHISWRDLKKAQIS